MLYNVKTKEELVDEIKRLRKRLSYLEVMRGEKLEEDEIDSYELRNELNKLNNNLTELNSQYHSIFNQPFLGIVHFDAERTVINCNGKFIDIVGLPFRDIVGHNLFNLFDDKEILISIKNALLGRISVFEGEYINLTSRKKIFIKAFFSGSISEDGKLIQGTGIFEDITERKETEKEIEMLARSIENISECVSITDSENNIMFVNRAFLETYGYKKEEVIGKSINIIRSKEVPQKLGKEIYELTSAQGWQGEIQNIKKDGSVFPIFLSTASLKDKDGNLYARIGVARDISHQKQVEKELINSRIRAEQSEMLKSEFLAQMSHEIRTPLNVILNVANMILEDHFIDADEDTKATFYILDSAGKRITRTIELILNMSEVQSGTYDYTPSQFDLFSDMYELHFKEFKQAAEAKDIEFAWIKNTKDTIIYADSYSVSQIFSNLLHNALKFTHFGKVEVNFTRDDENNLTVNFTDTGIGISKRFLPHLFTTFSQEDQGHTRKFEGNGLGLALVKSYCDLNNATIDVKSTKGAGTEFRVVFSK